MSESKISYGRVIGKLDKKGFLRKAMWEFYLNAEAPEDFETAEFTPVYEDTIYYAEICGTYDVEYTVDVGYKRQESYVEYEKYQQRVGDRLETRERPVTKFREVMDWHPLQNRAQGVQLKFRVPIAERIDHTLTKDDPEMGKRWERLMEKYYGFDTECAKIEPLSREEWSDFPAAPSEEVCESVARNQASDTRFLNALGKDLPGDTNRHFRGSFILKDVVLTRLFKQKLYKVGVRFAGRTGIYAKTDSQEISSSRNIGFKSYTEKEEMKKKLEAEKKERLATDSELEALRKKKKQVNTIGYTATVILGLIFGAMGLGIFAAVALVATVVLGYRLRKQIHETEKTITADYDNQIKSIGNDLKDKKVAVLNQQYAAVGLEPLTEEQIKAFKSYSK